MSRFKESSLAFGLGRDLPAPLLAAPSTSFWTLGSRLWRPWQLEDVKAVPAPEEEKAATTRRVWLMNGNVEGLILRKCYPQGRTSIKMTSEKRAESKMRSAEDS